MPKTKCKVAERGKEVYVVLAYKLTGGTRGNRVFFKVFGSSLSANRWITEIQNQGFLTQLNKKVIVP